jgi:hypothetical protein
MKGLFHIYYRELLKFYKQAGSEITFKQWGRGFCVHNQSNLILTFRGLLVAVLQMKHTMLLAVLAVYITTATSDLDCSTPLNCTGVFHCPLILSGPGVVIQSGAKYCSCCPVSITYLGIV